jgi:eukaryotic-like serine/threonine-protein kinase
VSPTGITRVLGRVRLLPPRYIDPVPIASGGMGEVVRVTDTELGRTVAVKLLAERYADEPEAAERFKREAVAAGRLSGEPHTVTIYDVGSWGGRPYIVMEYLAGGSLDEVLRAIGVPPRRQSLAWLADAAAALDHAHANGVVHRDVKPANLLLDEQGTLHVADFGIATAVGSAELTLTGTVLGTAGYLSPEQARGEPATPASDRYALAVVAFELLTGERPFGHAPPAGREAVFQRALADEPALRFETCAAFVDALCAPHTDTSRTRVLPTPGRRRGPRRRTVVLAALAVPLAAGGALAASLASSGRHAQSAPPPPRTVTVTTTAPAQPPPAPADRGAALVALATDALRTGRCDGVAAVLAQATSLGVAGPAVDQLRADCTGPPGHRPGHGHRHGHGLPGQGDQGDGG